jgi:hypothetical protein
MRLFLFGDKAIVYMPTRKSRIDAPEQASHHPLSTSVRIRRHPGSPCLATLRPHVPARLSFQTGWQVGHKATRRGGMDYAGFL